MRNESRNISDPFGDSLDGGTGANTLIGGAGDDAYVVDNAADIATESANEDIDTVRASVSHTLSANVEHLSLTGTANIDGTCNELANTLIGNAGANLLSGGAGNDILDGGGGVDSPIGLKSRRWWDGGTWKMAANDAGWEVAA